MAGYKVSEGDSLRELAGAWRLDARCAGATPHEQKVMTSGRSTEGSSIRDAREVVKKYCTDCPVKRECGDWAQGELYFTGIAAGAHYGWEKNKAATYAGRRITKI